MFVEPSHSVIYVWYNLCCVSGAWHVLGERITDGQIRKGLEAFSRPVLQLQGLYYSSQPCVGVGQRHSFPLQPPGGGLAFSPGEEEDSCCHAGYREGPEA